jgi:hypothetical protein
VNLAPCNPDQVALPSVFVLHHQPIERLMFGLQLLEALHLRHLKFDVPLLPPVVGVLRDPRRQADFVLRLYEDT